MHTFKLFLQKILPTPVLRALRIPYHFSLQLIGALRYRFPSREINIIGVTGTKGKTTTVELVNAFLEAAGYRTAISSTVRFKIGDESNRNMLKMTMPGRLALQKFLRDAVTAQCDWVILEMTSEGVLQSRHRFIALDGLIVTNLSPEHIESHGSFEKYREAKLKLVASLVRSSKSNRVLVLNHDDPEHEAFLEAGEAVPEKKFFSLHDAEPHKIRSNDTTLTLNNTVITTPLAGTFNVYNILAAAAFAEHRDISTHTIQQALEQFDGVPGRGELIRLPKEHPHYGAQHFQAVVDYAHTPDSLRQFYDVFANTYNICILGNTGGGRDTWKRPEMARIAEEHCAQVILTNEDPYDEDPHNIVDDMAAGISNQKILTIEMDRRKAIARALKKAKAKTARTKDTSVTVLITGKGTDPYIMGPNGSKEPWDDATVVREELEKLFSKK